MFIQQIDTLVQTLDTLKIVESLPRVPMSYSPTVSGLTTVNTPADPIYSLVGYLLTAIVFMLIANIRWHYWPLVAGGLKAFTSGYLMERALDVYSYSNAQLFLRLRILKAITLAIIVGKMYPAQQLLPPSLTSLDGVVYPLIYLLIFLLVGLFVNVGGRVCQILSKSAAFNRTVKRCLKYFFLRDILDVAVSIIVLTAVFLVPIEYANILKYIFLGLLLAGFLDTLYRDCNFFYNSNATILQFILYFCAVKSFQLAVVLYLIWGAF